MAATRTVPERIAAIHDRVDIGAVVGRVIKLGRGNSPRGKCPFHGSTSDSFSVATAPRGGGVPFAHCFGCGWHGDVIRFVVDYHGLAFLDALARLEAENGLDDIGAAPVRRERAPQARRERSRELVDTAVMAKAIWNAAVPATDAIATYLRARGVPEAVLTAGRFGDLRFHLRAPIVPWPLDREPSSVPHAPAIAALVRRPSESGEGGGRSFEPVGLHLTFLSADLTHKMVRERRDGSLYPARKMLGETRGACVLLGRYERSAPLVVGEGNETVLSGLGLAGAGEEVCGIAALSLGNLQGEPLRTREGALPLHAIRPDPERPALAFAHAGTVTGLIDADMAPLLGQIDRRTGAHRGMAVIETRGGPVRYRPITPGERATICGELFVRSWRAAGCRRVGAFRPPMGRDFNDVAREGRSA